MLASLDPVAPDTFTTATYVPTGQPAAGGVAVHTGVLPLPRGLPGAELGIGKGSNVPAAKKILGFFCSEGLQNVPHRSLLLKRTYRINDSAVSKVLYQNTKLSIHFPNTNQYIRTPRGPASVQDSREGTVKTFENPPPQPPGLERDTPRGAAPKQSGHLRAFPILNPCPLRTEPIPGPPARTNPPKPPRVLKLKKSLEGTQTEVKTKKKH